MLEEQGGINFPDDTVERETASLVVRSKKKDEVVGRPEVRGKFLYVDGQKFYIKGVTYGTFGENPDTKDYPEPPRVAQDFASMADIGLNAVRVYTVPPRWLLDIAAQNGLRVLVGMPWEQHVAFLDIPGQAKKILARLKPDIESVAGHPALLAIAIGNEIPAGVVRWHGSRRTARFLEKLAALVRSVDPGALVTYVNFPTTEYLDLQCVDFVSFNVYLEEMERLDAYLARLHNLAIEKPLLMAEIGLDSQRNGLEMQALSLREQIITVFEAGVAGAFIFAWTDEWARGGHEIDDWDFGLTTRDRKPKPALRSVAEAFSEVPAGVRVWPSMTVVVCSYNGARTIEETLQHLTALDYPNVQIIVVDDGSTDETALIARGFDVELISTENRGLSNARNTGMENSRGEFIVYIDDDAYPDPQWLKYLAMDFEKHGYAALGGPNIGPPSDPDLAECVSNAPGGPVQVLVDDRIAEHIPGCNMALRAEALRAIGGFDAQFRVAGDDVDVCWRIEEAGGVIGFSHAALVWHHRRPSVATYLKQQRGYARAEALVARKWPQKYNRAGHLTWHGRLYGRGLAQGILTRQSIYHGQWGSAPFQSIYRQGDGLIASLPQMPEWYFLVSASILIGLFGFDWTPLLVLLGIGLAGLGISAIMALRGALRARFTSTSQGMDRQSDLRLRAIVFWLFFAQPIARLIGRMQHRLGPWSAANLVLSPVPRPREDRRWTEDWIDPNQILETMQVALGEGESRYAVGGIYDDWDFAVGLSVFGEIRLLLMNEEHGGGQQYFRLRSWPVINWATVLLAGFVIVLAVGAFAGGAFIAGGALVVLGLVLAVSTYSSLAAAAKAVKAQCLPVLASEEFP